MEGGKMSEPNEPPLQLDSWHITVKLNDGSDFKLEPDDLSIATIPGIQEAVDESVDVHIDHLKGKYGQEIEQAEDLHAQNSKRFVDYEKKSD